jgi:bifunctional N-acetylglucosamine-1-phosphate-uridyltransferase/glucosamine-1-phosphate-acetyltransferase GlmU-like protein
MGLSTDIRNGAITFTYDEGSSGKSRTYPIERRQVDSANCGWVIRGGFSVNIHPTAFLGKDVVVVGEDVTIGENARICGKVVIEDHVTIGKDAVFASEEPIILQGCYKMANDAEELVFLRTEAARALIKYVRL